MSNIREVIVDLLEKTMEKNDYMTLLSIQLKIKNGYYENLAEDKIKAEINYLKQYKKSYPQIAVEIEEVIDYIGSLGRASGE